MLNDLTALWNAGLAAKRLERQSALKRVTKLDTRKLFSNNPT